MPDWDALLSTAEAATLAAIAVVLVLVYGYVARMRHLMTPEGERNMSKLCTTIFLPCLLFSSIGPLATWDNLKEYWAIVVYSLVFQLISYAAGLAGVHLLGMPQWLTVCMVFNNTTSLPLLLLTSLGSTGTLDSLLLGDDTRAAALARGKVYILINSLVGNLTRFSFGPAMLRTDPPQHWHCWSHHESPHCPEKLETAHLVANLREAGADALIEVDETTRLLAGDDTAGGEDDLSARMDRRVRWRRWAAQWGAFVRDAFNPPMAAGLAAVVAGVVPFLHQLFFMSNGWMLPVTESITNLGALYAVLQNFVLGGHLRSKGYAQPPWLTLTYLFLFRFVVLPVIACAVVYAVRAHTGVLSDPVFDYTMILGSVGPPALTLAAIVDMADADDATVSAVASTVVLSYALAPLVSGAVTLALTVVGAMEARGMY